MLEVWPDLSEWLHWRRLLDVGLVAALIYHLLLLVRGSRSGALLTALGILVGLYFASRDDILDLPSIYWILDRVIGSIAVLLVVLFQEDIRRALSSTLRSPLMGGRKAQLSNDIIDEITRTCAELCSRGLGGLVVVEQQAPLDRYVQDGILIDADVSWQLLLAMFIPDHKSPTHDGAVIIQKGRIAAGACFLPLAGGAGIPGTLGSRHRAALGLADETDALVIVISEETSTCSLAHMGQLDLNLTPADLRERVRLLVGGQPEMAAWREQSWRRRISFHADGLAPARRQPPAVAAEVEPEPLRPPAPVLELHDLVRADAPERREPLHSEDRDFDDLDDDTATDSSTAEDRTATDSRDPWLRADHAAADDGQSAAELVPIGDGEEHGPADQGLSTPIDIDGDDE